MRLKDKDGRELEIRVWGNNEEDIQIDDAWYVDTNEVPTEEVLQQLEYTYSKEIYEQWYEENAERLDYEGIKRAEDYYESWKE